MATRKFCYLCGRVTADLHEGLCPDCFHKERVHVDLPSKIEAKVCRECSRHYSGKWRDVKGSNDHFLETLAKSEVERHLRHNLDSVKTDVKIRGSTTRGKGLTVELEVSVSSDSPSPGFRSKLATTLEVKEVLCPVCSKKAGGYYEAIVQLRSDSIDKLLEEAHSIIDHMYQRDKFAFLVEETPLPGGMDLKIGSAKAAKALGSYFKSHHGAVIKESATLMGRKDGKNIYRKTVLIRV